MNTYNYNDFATLVWAYRNGCRSQEHIDAMIEAAHKLTAYSYWGSLRQYLIEEGCIKNVLFAERLLDASAGRLQPQTHEEVYNAVKDKAPWIVADYKTFLTRMEIIKKIRDNYCFHQDEYENAEDTPDEMDAKGLSQEEWDALVVEWEKWIK